MLFIASVLSDRTWSSADDVLLHQDVFVLFCRWGQDTTESVLGSRPGVSAHSGSLLDTGTFRFQRCIRLLYSI